MERGAHGCLAGAGSKDCLSEVIEEANSKGPQIITRHGSERAVISFNCGLPISHRA